MPYKLTFKQAIELDILKLMKYKYKDSAKVLNKIEMSYILMGVIPKKTRRNDWSVTYFPYCILQIGFLYTDAI